MQKTKISFDLISYDSSEELPANVKALIEAAEIASEKAYAPYSNFRVGAALLLENGEVVVGCNQENASYPSGLCAERVAVYQAAARFPDIPIIQLAIYAASLDSDAMGPAAPCGNCRQSISEYEDKQGKPIKIWMASPDGKVYGCSSLADLLPLTFTNAFLK